MFDSIIQYGNYWLNVSQKCVISFRDDMTGVQGMPAHVVRDAAVFHSQLQLRRNASRGPSPVRAL